MKLFKPNIQKLTKKKNVHALIKVFNDSGWDTSIRIAAVSALGEMSDLQAVEALIEALKDSDSGVRQAAAATLGRLGDHRAVEPLVAALKDNDSGVRQWATAALGRLGDHRSVEPLIKALRDSNLHVREAAAKALGEIDDPRGVDALRDYQRAARREVQPSAQQEVVGEVLREVQLSAPQSAESIIQNGWGIVKGIVVGDHATVMQQNDRDEERESVDGTCAGYLGHLFTKLESRASTIALISHLACMKRRTGRETRELASQYSMNIHTPLSSTR